jgi:hypothetical protein
MTAGGGGGGNPISTSPTSTSFGPREITMQPDRTTIAVKQMIYKKPFRPPIINVPFF